MNASQQLRHATRELRASVAMLKRANRRAGRVLARMAKRDAARRVAA